MKFFLFAAMMCAISAVCGFATEISTPTLAGIPIRTAVAPSQEDLVSLKIGTVTAIADMTGVPQDKREKFADYLQTTFDQMRPDGSERKMFKFLNLSHEDQVLYLHVLSKMLNDPEHWDTVGVDKSLVSTFKIRLYDMLTFAFYNDCIDDLGYEQCAVKVLHPPLLGKDIDPWFKERLVHYIWSAIVGLNNKKKFKKFEHKDLDPIMDTFASIFKDKQNPFMLRREAASSYLREELRYDVLCENLRFIQTDPPLFASMGNAFNMMRDNFPQIADYFYEILEHPHEYPLDIVKGAHEFVSFDCYSFRNDPGNYRRTRTMKILYQLKEDKELAKTLRIEDDLQNISNYSYRH